MAQVTNVAEETAKFSWELNNLSIIGKITQMCRSKEFGDLATGKWYLEVNLAAEFGFNDLQLYICSTEQRPGKWFAKVYGDIQLSGNSKRIYQELCQVRVERSPRNTGKISIATFSIGKSQHSEKVRIDVTVGVFSIVDQSISPGRISLQDDLTTFVQSSSSSSGCDITLVCDGQTFKANRFLLAARSEVFRTMLFGGFKEAQQNEVNVNDVSAEVLREVLRFVATDSCPALEAAKADNVDRVLQLLIAADKFQIKALLLATIKALASCVTSDNRSKFLEVAEIPGCEELEELVRSSASRSGVSR